MVKQIFEKGLIDQASTIQVLDYIVDMGVVDWHFQKGMITEMDPVLAHFAWFEQKLKTPLLSPLQPIFLLR